MILNLHRVCSSLAELRSFAHQQWVLVAVGKREPSRIRVAGKLLADFEAFHTWTKELTEVEFAKMGLAEIDFMDDAAPSLE